MLRGSTWCAYPIGLILKFHFEQTEWRHLGGWERHFLCDLLETSPRTWG